MLTLNQLADAATAAPRQPLALCHPAQAMAELGDVAGLRELHEMGGWGKLDPSPLMIAIRHGQTRAAVFLLGSGSAAPEEFVAGFMSVFGAQKN